MGEKFEIELEDCYERFGGANEEGSPALLYRVKGFRTLVFDENGVERLRALNKKQGEEMRPISDLSEGSTFMLGGIEWEILDKDYQGGVFVLAKEPIEYRAFDVNNCNDWQVSSARNYLNEKWMDNFIKKAGGCDPIEFERDLTSDDGLKDYDTCRDFVSLITCEEYRRYRERIPEKSLWWWTLTPWSTPHFGHSSRVRTVYIDGSLSNGSACYGSGGLAPVLVLPFNTMVTERVKND